MHAAIFVLSAFMAIPCVSAQSLGSCKAGNGLAGQCISTKACGGAGGSSEPGLCPGDKNIQCCTFGTCTNSTGKMGKCLPTAACSGSREVGLCPGDKDIQCCVSGDPPAKPPADPPSRCGAPELNSASVDLITQFEGFRGEPYLDSAGLPTVGIGHLCGEDSCSKVSAKYGPFPMTEAEGKDLFQSDATRFKDCVSEAITVPFNENQYGALVSFTYNLGCGILEDDWIDRINAGEDPNLLAAEQMPKYNRAGGKVIKGLTRRRNAEVKLFQTPSDASALPPAC